MPPNGSCLLGSINLTRFVSEPFTPQARFEFAKFGEVVRVFTRMLDNVCEINGLPLPEQRAEILSKRRHGMGFLGLGSTLTLMGLRYDSPEGRDLAAQVARVMAIEGWKTGLELAKEKGPAPFLLEHTTLTGRHLAERPELASDGYAVGDSIPNRVLHAKYSRYMQVIAQFEPELVEELAHHGARFTHHTSIAPTGTIALSLGNNASNGIEPSFAHHYSRNVIVEGRKTKEKVEVYSYELLAYRALVDLEAMPGNTDRPLPAAFVDADAISPEAHVLMQAAVQVYVDSSISKTINVATDFPFEAFQDIYLLAADSGLKGCTTFRFNPAAFQGVLVKETDLANTTYRFDLEDGSVVEVKGNEQVEYEGQTHTAANLFDALKEGTFGKF